MYIEWRTRETRDKRRLGARDRERLITRIEHHAIDPASVANYDRKSSAGQTGTHEKSCFQTRGVVLN